jgi:hypothetical protein
MHNGDDSSPFSVQHIAYRGGSSLIDDDGDFVPLIKSLLSVGIDASGVCPGSEYLSRISWIPGGRRYYLPPRLVMYLSPIQIASKGPSKEIQTCYPSHWCTRMIHSALVPLSGSFPWCLRHPCRCFPFLFSAFSFVLFSRDSFISAFFSLFRFLVLHSSPR